MTALGTTGLPGWELIEDGMADLARGDLTPAALLLCIGAARLHRLGIVPAAANLGDRSPEILLYEVLRALEPRGAYGRYNSLIRRLVSFERALEQVHFRRQRQASRGERSHDPPRS